MNFVVRVPSLLGNYWSCSCEKIWTYVSQSIILATVWKLDLSSCKGGMGSGRIYFVVLKRGVKSNWVNILSDEDCGRLRMFRNICSK